MSDKKPHTKKNPAPTKWTSDEINIFLEIFPNYDLLWNVRHEAYSDRQKRDSAMTKLRDELIRLNVAVPDISFLRSKIKSIKTTYRQEGLKVTESKTSGKGTDDLYKPRLSWYDTADSFLKDVTVTRNSKSNLKLQLKPGEEQETGDSLDITEDDKNPEASASTSDSTSTPVFAPPPKKQRIGKLAKVESAISKLQRIAENRPTSSKSLDEFDIFGQQIANQLRGLPLRSSIILQEKFQSLITKERLNQIEPPSPTLSFASSSVSGYGDNDDEDYSMSILQEGSRLFTQL